MMFFTTLRELENAACVPPEPGELGSWCRGIQRCVPDFERAWAQQRRDHEAIFEQIERDDPALAHRVAIMRRKQADLVARFSAIRFAVSVLRRSEREPHGSWEPRRRGRDLRKDLLQLIVACRAFDREVSTWLTESQIRDRGVAD